MNKALMEKRGFLRHFLIALTVFLASWQSALAQDYDEEYTYEAGTFWYIPEARSYSLNDENLAELVRQNDGKERILFKRPGDLIVTAFLYQQNFGATVKNQGRGVGENIAAGSNSPAKVMEGWMNSPGHRKNILDPKFRELGVGYVYDGNTEYRHYWVQMFRR